jgi:hypothetical protein
VDKFIIDFCPKNEVQTSRTELETSRFFQGGQDVDEYVNDFCELIQHARYFEGAHIALTFQQGLNQKIQDHVACLKLGRPSDDSPQQWYAAAILCDENCISNEAFQTSSQITPPTSSPLNADSVFQRPLPCVTTFPPPVQTFWDQYTHPPHSWPHLHPHDLRMQWVWSVLGVAKVATLAPTAQCDSISTSWISKRDKVSYRMN